MKKIVKWLGASAIAAALLVGGIALAAYMILHASGVTKDGWLYVPTGSTYQSLLDSLRSGDKIDDVKQFELTAKIVGLQQIPRSGRYKLHRGMSNLTLVRDIKRGHQEPVRLTFNNIRTMDRLAGVVSRAIEPDSVSLLRLLQSDTMAARYGFNKQTFIAMFLPDSYEFYWNITPEAFIERMKIEHDKFWNSERKAKLEEIELTEAQAVTLASIVYEETKKVDEMARVAGVYLNRLRIGMPLQADPTVKFAIGDFAMRRIYHSHLSIDSPYNTYKYGGLPPGPIAMPSKNAINAVLNVERHNYIYFCARADFSGYHSFAASLAQHSQNARAYARALNARNIR